MAKSKHKRTAKTVLKLPESGMPSRVDELTAARPWGAVWSLCSDNAPSSRGSGGCHASMIFATALP
jgi:hypothetical protein